MVFGFNKDFKAYNAKKVQENNDYLKSSDPSIKAKFKNYAFAELTLLMLQFELPIYLLLICCSSCCLYNCDKYTGDRILDEQPDPKDFDPEAIIKDSPKCLDEETCAIFTGGFTLFVLNAFTITYIGLLAS